MSPSNVKLSLNLDDYVPAEPLRPCKDPDEPEAVKIDHVISPSQLNACRIIASLVVEGKPPSTIAEILSIEEHQVRRILSMPETVEVINELASTNIEQTIENVLRATALDSLFTLIEIRDNKGMSPKLRIDAAKEILNRFAGRPDSTSKTNRTSAPADLPTDPSEQARYLDAQIESLQARGS